MPKVIGGKKATYKRQGIMKGRNYFSGKMGGVAMHRPQAAHPMPGNAMMSHKQKGVVR